MRWPMRRLEEGGGVDSGGQLQQDQCSTRGPGPFPVQGIKGTMRKAELSKFCCPWV